MGIPGTTTGTSVTLYLEKYKNGEWTEDDSWISKRGGVNSTLSKTKYVEKGYVPVQRKIADEFAKKCFEDGRTRG